MIELGKLRVISWTPHVRGNTLVGFFDVSWGPLVVRRMTCHRNDVGYGVGLPQKRDGMTGPWLCVFDFASGRDRHDFKLRALDALLEFFEHEHMDFPSREAATCA